MSDSLASCLHQLKQNHVSRLLHDPQTLEELFERLDPGSTYSINGRLYAEAQRQRRHAMFCVGHFCLYRSSLPTQSLFWWEPRRQEPADQALSTMERVACDYFIHPLKQEEADQLRPWVAALPSEHEQERARIPMRFGPYRLDEMIAGDMLLLENGTFCEVHPRQSSSGVQVWVNAGTKCPKLTTLPNHEPVYGVSQAQARRVELCRPRGWTVTTDEFASVAAQPRAS